MHFTVQKPVQPRRAERRAWEANDCAPPACSAPQADEQLRVAYTADYFFYVSAST